MDNSSNKMNKADNAQGGNLQLQQQWRQQSSDHRAPEQRPYRRRIKPPPAKVHHVHPARFRRFVQRRTCCLQALPPQPNAPPPCGNSNSDDAATASTASSPTSTTNLLQPPPADTAIGGDRYSATDAAGCLDVAGKSMQEAYMAWCSSNDVPLSPGTMAELLVIHRAPLQ